MDVSMPATGKAFADQRHALDHAYKYVRESDAADININAPLEQDASKLPCLLGRLDASVDRGSKLGKKSTYKDSRRVFLTAADEARINLSKDTLISSLNIEPTQAHWNYHKCDSQFTPGNAVGSAAADDSPREVISCRVERTPFGVEFAWNGELCAFVVEEVERGSAAEQQGVMVGDELTHVAGVPVLSFEEASRALAHQPPFKIAFERECRQMLPADFQVLSGMPVM